MNKFSVRIIICCLFLIISGYSAYSQSLSFCEDVSKDGYPVKESSVFNISDKGGYLRFLVNLPYRIGTSSVSYDIFRIDSEGNESFDNTIYQDVEPSWTWFWKEVTFYSSGSFNVYVYDGDRNYLTSGTIRIQYY